jgi:hypothetical protein
LRIAAKAADSFCAKDIEARLVRVGPVLPLGQTLAFANERFGVLGKRFRESLAVDGSSGYQKDWDRISTSFVERNNKTIRMQIRRLTRLTDGHSKKWENHEAALALFFAYFNFCRVHSTLKTTPAVATGFAIRPWTLEELLDQATPA